MTTKIPEELEQAVSRADDGTLKVEGVNGTYWVMTDDALRIRSEVLKGLDEGDRGDVADWSPDEVKNEGRLLLQNRRQDT